MTRLGKLATGLVLFLCVLAWGGAAWRMRWDLLLMGQIPLMDFDIYYRTAKDVMAGQHPMELPYMQTGGPPSVILPFVLISIFPLAVARGLMFGSSIIALILAARVMARKYFGDRILIATCLMATMGLVAFPTRFNLGQGQPNLWLMLLVGWLISDSGKRWWIAALLAVIKTNYLVIFASFPFKKIVSLILIFMIVIGIGLE